MIQLEVAVAVIRDHQNRILIAKRPEHLHQGGLWEFPGGKIEVGESVKEALKREIIEELDVVVMDAAPLISIPHQYSDRMVRLNVCLVSQFSGEPQGLEGQEVRWIAQESLSEYTFPAANRAIVSALQLPDRYLITPEKNSVSELLEYLKAPRRTAVELIQFRAPNWTKEQYLAAVPSVVNCAHSVGARTILNADPELLTKTDADGIHLNRYRLNRLKKRPVGLDKWLGASCHNLAEIEQAQRLEVDYITLSPVLHTNTHPEKKPLGWHDFSALVELCSMPVFALGGMKNSDLKLATAAGGQGIAGIGLFG